ncbi:hypothetical protein FQR65_LT02659 [Abscondita terminalis]|nr:hypothetical protein FQR65_LT02659 [Abscondita terminalis]
MSDWYKLESGVLQESALEPLLFALYISNSVGTSCDFITSMWRLPDISIVADKMNSSDYFIKFGNNFKIIDYVLVVLFTDVIKSSNSNPSPSYMNR